VFKPALVGGDGVESAFRSDATAGSGVTDYPITLRLTGAAASNYDASGVGSGTLHITKRGLTGAIDPKSKNQGADNPPLTGSVGNNVAGDGFLVTYATPATPASEVGDYPITVDLTVAGGQNYSWNAANDGTLTVTEPPPTLSAALTIVPTSIPGGTTTALVVQLPSLSSGSAATVSLTISGCGAVASVPKVSGGGGAITAADLGTTISIDPPLSVATDTKTCTYTLTVSNAANPPGTATSTATLDIVPAQ
jgi:hypothetical protein